MLLKPASKIEKSDIDALIENQVRESREVEYKSELPKFNDDGRREFLADVSAFANSGGGHLLFGIGDVKSEAGVNTGEPVYVGLKNFNADMEIPRLEQVIKLGIQPTISGFQIQVVDGFPEGPILVISIPQSWNAPHQVTFNNWSRFFLRTSAGKSQMDVSQIRRAFLDADGFETRISKFRSERIQTLLGDTGPLPVGKDGLLVIHWIPIESFLSGLKISTSDLSSAGFNLSFAEIHLGRSRFNLDGYLKYSTDSGDQTGRTAAYIQLFRNGSIEAVDCYQLMKRNSEGRVISPHIEATISKLASQMPNLAKKLSLNGPYVFAVSLLNVRGYTLQVANRFSFGPGHPVDRSPLLLPEQILESVGSDLFSGIRPTLDALWNSLGEQNCIHYDKDGSWKA